MVATAIAFQFLLLLYHQLTTLADFFPFNGSRFYSRRESLLEAGSNFVLMSLPLAGFTFQVSSLMNFGVEYYFILFAVECATWWAPYFLGASPEWRDTYRRIHRQTITILPRRGENPVPNVEHLILMFLTLLTATFTFLAWRSLTLSFSSWWIGVVVGAFFAGGTVFQFCFKGRSRPVEPRAEMR